MGWASGSLVMSNIIERFNMNNIDDDVRESIYGVLIDEFENSDCDTLHECLGEDPAFDAAYKEASYFSSDDIDEEEDE